jgi:hypothetical protein
VISRRQLLLGSGAFALGCKGNNKMDPQAVPPWHLWGGSTSIVLTREQPATGAGGQQVARVAYGRPDTWEFLFVCKIVGIVGPLAPAPYDVRFQLNVGVGRSSVDLPDFAQFQFQPGDPAGTAKFCTQIQTADINQFFQFAPTVMMPNVVDHFPAQDIQCAARAFAETALSVGTEIRIEASAYFSPRSHIRPEWSGTPVGTRFSGNTIPRFPGSEDKGH